MGLEGRRALFISYNGMLEPLGQTQVIPYLSELAKKGVRMFLLSFEKPSAYTPEGISKCEQLKQKLLSRGIEWHWLQYHQKPSIPATAYDVLAGIRYAKQLVAKNKIELVHARGHIPATIALSLKKSTGVRMIFDLRGLMADEYVDAEHWKRGSLAYRITKATERRILFAADAVVTLTHRIWPIIREWQGLAGRPVLHEVIPCCVDMDVFNYVPEARERLRQDLGIQNEPTLVYSGSLDGWYLTAKMADFFARFLTHHEDAHLIWLTTGSRDRVKSLMQERNIKEKNYSVHSVPADQVPLYLSAADIGLSFIKPCFSKLASSPTKNGEYLACGLPLVLNAGIGDSDSLVNDWRAGALIEEFEDKSYDKATGEIETMLADSEIRSKMREVAKRVFDLPTVAGERYAALYERVLSDKD